MPGADDIHFDWGRLTSDCAAIVEAYFALFCEQEPTEDKNSNAVRGSSIPELQSSAS